MNAHQVVQKIIGNAVDQVKDYRLMIVPSLCEGRQSDPHRTRRTPRERPAETNNPCQSTPRLVPHHEDQTTQTNFSQYSNTRDGIIEVDTQMPPPSNIQSSQANNQQSLFRGTSPMSSEPTSQILGDSSSNISEAGNDQPSDASPSTGFTQYTNIQQHPPKRQCHNRGDRPLNVTTGLESTRPYSIQTALSQHGSFLGSSQAHNVSTNFAHQQGSEKHTNESHPSSSGLQAMDSSLTTVAEPQITNPLGNGHTLEVDNRRYTDEQVAYTLTTLSHYAQANNQVSIYNHDSDDIPPENQTYRGMPTDIRVQSTISDAGYEQSSTDSMADHGTEHLDNEIPCPDSDERLQPVQPEARSESTPFQAASQTILNPQRVSTSNSAINFIYRPQPHPANGYFQALDSSTPWHTSRSQAVQSASEDLSWSHSRRETLGQHEISGTQPSTVGNQTSEFVQMRPVSTHPTSISHGRGKQHIPADQGQWYGEVGGTHDPNVTSHFGTTMQLTLSPLRQQVDDIPLQGRQTATGFARRASCSFENREDERCHSIDPQQLPLTDTSRHMAALLCLLRSSDVSMELFNRARSSYRCWGSDGEITKGAVNICKMVKNDEIFQKSLNELGTRRGITRNVQSISIHENLSDLASDNTPWKKEAVKIVFAAFPVDRRVEPAYSFSIATSILPYLRAVLPLIRDIRIDDDLTPVHVIEVCLSASEYSNMQWKNKCIETAHSVAMDHQVDDIFRKRIALRKMKLSRLTSKWGCDIDFEQSESLDISINDPRSNAYYCEKLLLLSELLLEISDTNAALEKLVSYKYYNDEKPSTMEKSQRYQIKVQQGKILHFSGRFKEAKSYLLESLMWNKQETTTPTQATIHLVGVYCELGDPGRGIRLAEGDLTDILKFHHHTTRQNTRIVKKLRLSLAYAYLLDGMWNCLRQAGYNAHSLDHAQDLFEGLRESFKDGPSRADKINQVSLLLGLAAVTHLKGLHMDALDYYNSVLDAAEQCGWEIGYIESIVNASKSVVQYHLGRLVDAEQSDKTARGLYSSRSYFLVGFGTLWPEIIGAWYSKQKRARAIPSCEWECFQ
jgi:hypothetical protein